MATVTALEHIRLFVVNAQELLAAFTPDELATLEGITIDYNEVEVPPCVVMVPPETLALVRSCLYAGILGRRAALSGFELTKDELLGAVALRFPESE